MNAFLSFLFENWPYAIWIAIGGIVVYLYFIIKNKADGAHTKITNLPCEAHRELLNKYEHEIIMQNKKLSTIDVLNGKFDVMMQTLQTMAGNREWSITKTLSPISLTDYGKSLADELNMEHYILSNWKTISKYIEDNSESMNPYDIQQFCFNYVLLKTTDALSREGHDRVKLKAFTLGVPIFDLLQAAAIIIRDKFFKEHNINIADIDIFEPKSGVEEGCN